MEGMVREKREAMSRDPFCSLRSRTNYRELESRGLNHYVLACGHGVGHKPSVADDHVGIKPDIRHRATGADEQRSRCQADEGLSPPLQREECLGKTARGTGTACPSTRMTCQSDAAAKTAHGRTRCPLPRRPVIEDYQGIPLPVRGRGGEAGGALTAAPRSPPWPRRSARLPASRCGRRG